MDRQQPLRLNFTKKALEALPVDPKKRLVYHDIHAHGLCLRIESSGHRKFCWQRKVNGQATFKPIGRFPDLSVENARTKAAEYNSQFARWKSDEYRGNSPFEPQRRDLTLTELLEDYIQRHLQAEAKNPDRAIRGVRWQFQKYVPPSWKTRQLDGIKKHQVLDLHKTVRQDSGLFTANRLVQLLRALYNWALKHMDWKGENPAAGVKLYAESVHRRDRFLNRDELARLFTALRDEPQRDLRDFVLMSLMTAARMGDVLSAQWKDITFDPPAWTVPNPKARRKYVIPLMSELVTVLLERRDLSADDNPWVFPGRGRTQHVTGFKHSWPALLKRAKIPGLRIHDLRRTLGSVMAQSNVSLLTIGKALGHSSTASTEGSYAHLQTENVRQAFETATKAMLGTGKA